MLSIISHNLPWVECQLFIELKIINKTVRQMQITLVQHKHTPSAVPMLGQRQRRWPSIGPALGGREMPIRISITWITQSLNRGMSRYYKDDVTQSVLLSQFLCKYRCSSKGIENPDCPEVSSCTGGFFVIHTKRDLSEKERGALAGSRTASTVMYAARADLC